MPKCIEDNCKWAKQGKTSMFCSSPKAKRTGYGRGNYTYLYTECDCGDYHKKSFITNAIQIINPINLYKLARWNRKSKLYAQIILLIIVNIIFYLIKFL